MTDSEQGDSPTSLVALPIFHGRAAILQQLAAMCVRHGQAVMSEGRLVAGVDLLEGGSVGLSVVDRKVMAHISRWLLESGRVDTAGEIHDLFELCTKPLGTWLPGVAETGLGVESIAFISAESGLPTVEAAELGSLSSSFTASLQEIAFSELIQLVNAQPRGIGDALYTAIREFAIRNPVCEEQHLAAEFARLLVPSDLIMFVRTRLYESVPPGWGINGKLIRCAHCGDAMRPSRVFALECRTAACRLLVPAMPGQELPLDRSYRVTAPFRQFMVEPGVHEIRLFDRLIAGGVKAVLYPNRDRVDIAVGSVGIDLKAYGSPEVLGRRLSSSLGGLSYYEDKWLVIPAGIAAAVPSYMERLSRALGAQAYRLRILTDIEAGDILLGASHA